VPNVDPVSALYAQTLKEISLLKCCNTGDLLCGTGVLKTQSTTAFVTQYYITINVHTFIKFVLLLLCFNMERKMDWQSFSFGSSVGITAVNNQKCE